MRKPNVQFPALIEAMPTLLRQPLIEQLKRGYFCSHHAAVGNVKRQHTRTCIVAAAFEIGIQKTESEIGTLAHGQVHMQKCDIAQDIDPTQCGIELDAIEGKNLGTNPHQVTQMQIAVALAHPAVELAL